MATHVNDRPSRSPRPVAATRGRRAAVAEVVRSEAGSASPLQAAASGGKRTPDAGPAGELRTSVDGSTAVRSPAAPAAGPWASVLEHRRVVQAAARPAATSVAARVAARPLTEAEKRGSSVKMRRVPRAPRDPSSSARRSRRARSRPGSTTVRCATRRVKATIGRPPFRRNAVSRSRSIPRSPRNWSMPRQAARRPTGRAARAGVGGARSRALPGGETSRWAIAKEAPDVATAHEVHGLASYRLGQFKPAVRSLEAALDLHRIRP